MALFDVVFEHVYSVSEVMCREWHAYSDEYAHEQCEPSFEEEKIQNVSFFLSDGFRGQMCPVS
jgi:hypothetical protein